MTVPRHWLFFKEQFAWPRASGHDVHTYYLMKSLAAQGHLVSLLTRSAPPPDSIAGIALDLVATLDTLAVDSERAPPLRLTPGQERFRNYWGVAVEDIQRLAAHAERIDCDCVVVCGLNVLPYLGAVTGRVRVWYAADEWVVHHLSQLRLTRPATWGELKAGLVKGLYERAYRTLVDRAWAVTPADARAFRRLAGYAAVDVIPNGVDADHYAPDPSAAVDPNRLVFWGRLDFGPNVQALRWFLGAVWPVIRRELPDTTLAVYGFQPDGELRRLLDRPGVSLTVDLPDIRPEVRRSLAAVMPFVSGGGIKNKLLEAAGMAVPVLATARAVSGLAGRPPVTICRRAGDWVRAIRAIRSDPEGRAKAGAANRAWVTSHHSWDAAATIAAEGLTESVRGGGA